MNVSFIGVGDELLLGQVVDTNSVRAAEYLFSLGLSIQKKYCVQDRQEEIIKVLAQASLDSDVILISGGLGPTRDDITKEALAAFLAVPLVYSDRCELHVKQYLEKRGISMNEIQKVQCYIPENAVLLENPLGTALGIFVEHGGKVYCAMPGVPYEMDFILQNSLSEHLGWLGRQGGLLHESILIGGMGETAIAEIIEPLLTDLPEAIKLAYLPSIGTVTLRLTGDEKLGVDLKENIKHYMERIKTALDKNVLADSSLPLALILGRRLKALGLTLSTAESCTGGLISHRISSHSGSSDYFLGGVVSYSNLMKEKVLSVPEQTIEERGVVSEETVKMMLLGACSVSGSDIAIASTGIAGPGGGTEENPVGTVWIAVGNSKQMRVKKLQLKSDRTRNIEAATNQSFLLALEHLQYLQ